MGRLTVYISESEEGEKGDDGKGDEGEEGKGDEGKGDDTPEVTVEERVTFRGVDGEEIYELTIEPNSEYNLSYTYSPEDADTQSWEWYSNDSGVATVTVSRKGVIVSAYNSGATDIVVYNGDKTEIGRLTVYVSGSEEGDDGKGDEGEEGKGDEGKGDDTPEVTVEERVTFRGADGEEIYELTIEPNGAYNLSYTYSPEDADTQSWEWYSNDSGVATVTVSRKGVIVSAYNSGTTDIVVYNGDKTEIGRLTVYVSGSEEGEKGDDGKGDEGEEGKGDEGKGDESGEPTVSDMPTGITIYENNLTLNVGDTHYISYSLSPEGASEAKLIWAVEAAPEEAVPKAYAEVIEPTTTLAVVSVENGVITALNPGTATINVYNTNNNWLGSLYVEVTAAQVTGISLNYTELTMNKGDTKTIVATVLPEGAKCDSYSCWTSNYGIVEVQNNYDNTFTIEAKKAGTTTVYISNGNGITAECVVTVKPTYVESITMKSEMTLRGNGYSYLYPTVSPSNADNKGLIYTSSNESVATVDSSGKVTAVGNGTATIRATAKDGSGVYAECTVTTVYAKSITMDSEMTLRINGYDYLYPTINYPTDSAGNLDFSWEDDLIIFSSSDESVATVSSSGKVNAVGAGTATIRATATDGSGVYAECLVTVEIVYVNFIELGANRLTLNVGDSDGFYAQVNAADISTLAYTSSNEGVVKVELVGDYVKVTAVGKGKAMITATATDGSGVYAECLVIVKNSGDETVDDGENDEVVLSGGGKCGENLTWTLNDKGLFTINGTGNMYDYDFYGGPWKFHYGSRITSVVISDGVTSVGDYAFGDCSLTNLTIPNSVKSIGNHAFDGCSFTRVVIPDSVTSIGKSAFAGSSLKNLTIPNSVTSIENATFWRCGDLENITIGSGVTSIGDRAFGLCTALESITIPDSVKTIGDEVFYNCEHLESIAIGAGLASMGDYLFGEDSYALQYFTVAENNPNYSVDSLGVLYNKNKTVLVQYPVGKPMMSFDIPNTVTEIRKYAFYRSDVGGITIPNSVTSIGDWAFYNIDGLYSLTIPDSVKTIGNYAFCSCYNLREIRIGSGVTSIGDSAFSSCESLKSLTLPDSVTTIGEDAFYYCSKLASLTIPESVTTIGRGAFDHCPRLKSIVIPNSVTAIEDKVFRECFDLTTVTIPDSVTSIGYGAFSFSHDITTVNFTGTEWQWNNISIGEDNDYLTNATINFEYKKPVPASFKTVSCTYSEGKVTASVEFNNVDQGGVLYLAFYNGNRLVCVKEKTVAAGETENTLEITNVDESYKNYKVKAFLWSGKNLMKPQAVFAETTVK